MRRLALLMALLVAPAAFGQALVQRSQPCQVPGNTSKVPCSLPRALSTGTSIRVVEIDRSGAGTRSVPGLTQIGTASGLGGTVTVWRGAPSGATSFTVSLPNAYNPVVWVQEDTYPATLDGVAVSASGALNQQPQPISAGTLTVSSAADYILVGCEDNMGAGGLTAGMGYNAFQTATFVPGGFEDRIAGATGGFAANGKLAFAQYQWTCLGLAFAGGSGPPPPPPPPPQTCTGTATVGVNGQVIPPLSLTSPVTLPQATVGVAYSVNLSTAAAVSGGTPPYTFALMIGTALPAGLTLSTAGVISGTPTTAGTTTFSYIVTDSGGHAMIVEMTVVAAK